MRHKSSFNVLLIALVFVICCHCDPLAPTVWQVEGDGECQVLTQAGCGYDDGTDQSTFCLWSSGDGTTDCRLVSDYFSVEPLGLYEVTFCSCT